MLGGKKSRIMKLINLSNNAELAKICVENCKQTQSDFDQITIIVVTDSTLGSCLYDHPFIKELRTNLPSTQSIHLKEYWVDKSKGIKYYYFYVVNGQYKEVVAGGMDGFYADND